MLSICSSPKLRSHSWYLIFFTSSPSAVILVSSTFRTYPDFSLYLHHPAPGHHYLFPWCMKKDSCLTASLLPLMESILNLTARSLTAVRSCHLFVQNSPMSLILHRVKVKNLCGPASCSHSLRFLSLSPMAQPSCLVTMSSATPSHCSGCFLFWDALLPHSPFFVLSSLSVLCPRSR